MATAAAPKPNVVCFGDSNTYVFGPVLRAHLVREGWPSAQVVVKYRSGSSPGHWLAKGHAEHRRGFGELWQRALPFSGSTVADALDPATALVVVGLGGNASVSARTERAIAALVDQIERVAPSARIVWRGLPPATATRGRRLATLQRKASRYRKNAMLKQALVRRGFAIVDSTGTSGSLARLRRAYVDLIALHAGGPSSARRPTVGSAADLERERAAIERMPGGDWITTEVATRGPWVEFTRARDGLDTHVPRDAAAALYDRVLGPTGLFDAPRGDPPSRLLATVVEPRARLRIGPPRFRWDKPRMLRVGEAVVLTQWRGRFGKVESLGGEPLGWTLRANLSAGPLTQLA